jgi:hypothetical protein
MERPVFKFTTDRHGLPLIVWSNPPGLDADFTPDQLRRLAVDLLEAAIASVSPVGSLPRSPSIAAERPRRGSL